MSRTISLFLSLILLFQFSAFAQDAGPAKGGILSVVKEIYVEGSIDNKSVFMVYGFENSLEDSKDLMEKAISLRSIKDLGKMFNNKDHDKDYFNSVEEGSDFSKEAFSLSAASAKGTYQWPSNSVKRMKKSFALSMENGQDAYYNSKNQVTGTLKYSGHAIWAVVKGAYFLVVEVPAVEISAVAILSGSAVAGAASVPGSLILHTLRIGLKTTGMVLRAGLNTASAGIALSYSAASTTIASAATLIAFGAVQSVKGIVYLAKLPANLSHPIKVTKATEIDLNQQKDLADKAKTALSSLSSETVQLTLKDSKITKYRSSFELSLNKSIKADISISLSVENQKVNIDASAKKSLIEFFMAQGASKADAKEAGTKLLNNIIETILLYN